MRMKTLAEAACLALIATALAGPAAAQSLAGNYQDNRGGRSSTLSIAEAAGGRYRVQIEIGAPRCMGTVDAAGQMRGDSLIASQRESGQTCTLTIRRQGSALSVSENNCLLFHGASCEFSGIYQRRGR